MASSTEFPVLLEDYMKTVAHATLISNAEEEPHKLNAQAGYYRGLHKAKTMYEEFIKKQEEKLG